MLRLKLFHRVILRPLLREPIRLSLTLAAVTLGVAVVIAIDLAGVAAAGSFRSSMESLAGKAAFEIAGTTPIPERVMGSLATLPLPLRFEPRIEEFVRDDASGRTITLIGLDLVSNPRRASVTGGGGDVSLLDEPRGVWASTGLGRKPGDTIRVIVQDREEMLHVAGVFESGEQVDDGGSLILVADIPVAQEITGRMGSLDRIEVHVPSDMDEDAVRRAVADVLPPGVELRPFGARTDANRRMLNAFRWNLRVLSGVALVVGAFLIFNTISVSVVRRRGEIGILRAIGVTQAGAQSLFLLEAAAFGAVGGALGVVTGYVLALAAVDLLAVTVNSLYVTSQPGAVVLTPAYVVAGLALGIGVSTAAALAPALEAGNVAPVEAMASGSRDHTERLHTTANAIRALVLLAAGWALCYLPPVQGTPLFGYVATLLLILGAALLTPALIAACHRASGKAVQRVLGVEALLAARSLHGNLRRSAVLVGALATAVAMVASVSIMVGSFRETVRVWMDNQMRADLYLRAAAPGSPGKAPSIDPSVAHVVAELPEVEAIDRMRSYSLMLNGKPADFSYTDAKVVHRHGRISFLPGQDRDAILRQMAEGDYVVVSEPFAQKHNAGVGSRLVLPLATGNVPVRVIGVFNDYSTERGAIYGDERVFAKYFPTESITGIAVYLRPGVSPERGREAVERATAHRRVLITSNQSLRRSAMRVFDQTFSITWALEGVAIFVAVMGMAGALMAMVIDRRRELGMLRFLGASQGQIRKLVYFEAAFLGLLSNAAGLALGLALSLVLIYVINRQSFGWTFQFHWPGFLLLAALSVICVATLFSAWFPARAAAGLNPTEVIREE
jgi:putative ABC transport system permease protein